jgi:ABC-type sugar transport system substrate-binding protein
LDNSSIEGNADGTQGESAPVEYRCISNPESEKKIYVILKNYHGDYWKTVIEGVEKAAKEVDAAIYLGGIDNETDISGQTRLMNEAIEQGADGILLAPANSNSLVESCAKAKKKNISVVLIDSSINSTEFDTCYMTDNIDAGKMAAKEMTIRSWNTVIIRYFSGNSESGFGIFGGMDTVCAIAMGYCQRYFLKWRRCEKSTDRCLRFAGKE